MNRESLGDVRDESRVYLVCDGCGFFYGDIRLYPDATVECPHCASDAAWAFPKIEKALALSEQIKERNRG